MRLFLVLALLTVAAACTPAPAEPVVRVGVGSTAEQRMLAALTLEALDRAGMTAEPRTEQGDTVALRGALRRSDIDVYWDYTGAAWVLGMQGQVPPADPEESYEQVRSADAEIGLEWLAPTTANATLALFVRAEDAVPEPTLTWLAGQLSAGGLPLCADPDFLDRPAGYPLLVEEYSIAIERVPTVDASEGEAIRRVASRECFAALGTATSGEALRAQLVRVADDQAIFPAFVIAPVARGALTQLPELRAALEPLVARLSTDSLAVLNAQLEPGDDPQPVAAEFLADLEPRDAPAGPADS